MQKLVGVDIFAAGKWNGDVYTEKDLDEMVRAFVEAPIKPPLKLGHDEAQRWFGQSDGAPALGWVDKLYRAGKQLLADFAEVPDVVVDLIRTGKYRNKSAEIYWNFEADGKKWPRALKAVSLLGADIPAVSSLEDLRKVLLSTSTAAVSYTDAREVRTYSYGGQQMDGEMEKKYKELEAKLAVYEAKVAEGLVTLADLQKRTEKAEERALKAEAELLSRDETHAIETFTVTVDGLIKAGKVLPAEKDRLIRTFSALGSGTKKYGDKEFSPREEFTKSLEDRPVIVNFKEKGKGGESGSDELHPAVAVDKEIRRIVSEKKCTYSEGMQILKSEQPDLWLSYVKPQKKEE